MSAFVVFSMLGFYPVTPGLPEYQIGSPMFDRATIQLADGKKFEIVAENNSPTNKYIQSATLNGKPVDGTTLQHADLASGGRLVFSMGPEARKQ